METHDGPSRAGSEEDVLMPRTSPRTPGRHVNGRRPQTGRRYISTRSEREYAALADQLEALHDDIHHAQEVARLARQMPGLRAGHDLHPPAAPPRGEPVTLANGARILLRPIEPGDDRLTQTVFEHLSAVSRYRRFLTPIHHLSKSQIEYLSDVDHQQHEALIALDPTSGEGVGIARWLRDPGDIKQAEVAIVVADAWQGSGVGCALTELLAVRARAAGVERLTARMLIGNHAGWRLLERVAQDITQTPDGGTIEVTARLRALR